MHVYYEDIIMRDNDNPVAIGFEGKARADER